MKMKMNNNDYDYNDDNDKEIVNNGQHTLSIGLSLPPSLCVLVALNDNDDNKRR